MVKMIRPGEKTSQGDKYINFIPVAINAPSSASRY
jgi:hypothetical protein